MKQKYIIDNCPAKETSSNNWCIFYSLKCKDVESCLLKQIVSKTIDKATIGGVCETSEEILALINISEAIE